MSTTVVQKTKTTISMPINFVVYSPSFSPIYLYILEHLPADKNHISNPKLKSSCEPFRYVLPRPRVYSKCKTAFDRALRTTCPKACNFDFHHFHAEEEAHTHCKKERKEVPRPQSYDACNKGYIAGAYAAEEFAKATKTLFEKMQEELEAEDNNGDSREPDKGVKAAPVEEPKVNTPENVASAEEAQEDVAALRKKAVEEVTPEEELRLAREAARAAYRAEQERRKKAESETTQTTIDL